MDAHVVTARTALQVGLAVLFAMAALAFGQQALEAWNANHTLRLVIALLAMLGAVSLAAGRLRRVRRPAGPGDTDRRGAGAPSD